MLIQTDAFLLPYISNMLGEILTDVLVPITPTISTNLWIYRCILYDIISISIRYLSGSFRIAKSRQLFRTKWPRRNTKQCATADRSRPRGLRVGWKLFIIIIQNGGGAGDKPRGRKCNSLIVYSGPSSSGKRACIDFFFLSPPVAVGLSPLSSGFSLSQ